LQVDSQQFARTLLVDAYLEIGRHLKEYTTGGYSCEQAQRLGEVMPSYSV